MKRERRPGEAWCSPHNMHPSDCFDLHHPELDGIPKRVIDYDAYKTVRKDTKAIVRNGKLYKEVSYVELREMHWTIQSLPNVVLSSWGFDTTSGIEIHDDTMREVYVFTQNRSNGTSDRRDPEPRERQDPVGRSGLREIGHRLGILRRK